MSKGRLAHWRVAKVALEMARATWEHLATVNNKFYQNHPDRGSFSRMHQAKFLPFARRALADALNLDTLTEPEKDEIIASLALDQPFVPREAPRSQLVL